jgi:hypothetical protein
MTKLLNKKLILIILQLAVYGIFWYLNFVVIFTYVPTLRSMTALSTATSKTGGMFLDFAKNYACAEIAKTNPNVIWDANAQAETLNKLLNAHSTDPGIPARTVYCAPYTPQSLLLLMPLTMLPLNQAIIIFEIFSILFSISAISLLIKQYQHFSTTQIIIWWVIFLAAFPFLQNICLGQMTFILAGLLALFIINWNNKNVILPSVCLGLALAVKPQRALIMLIMLLATKRYRLFLGVILFSVLLLGCCVIFMGINPILVYPSKLQAIEAGRYALKLHSPLEWTTSYYLGLPSVISAIFQKSLGHELVTWSSILDFVMTYLIWKKAGKKGTHTYPFAFAVTLLIDLMIGPYANLYDIFFMALAWAITLPAVELANFSKIKTPALRLWFLAFSFFPIASWLIETYCMKYGGTLHMLLLGTVLIIALWNFKNVLSLSNESRGLDEPAN